MKKITFLVVTALLTLSVSAFAGDGAEGIQFFKGTFKEALAKAKKENKMIFMDAYTTWCGPCKMLKANVFPDKSLGEYMNKKYVAVAVDWESDMGQTLAQAYPLEAYPTLFFLDSTGKIKSKMVGVPRDNPAGAILREAQKLAK